MSHKLLVNNPLSTMKMDDLEPPSMKSPGSVIPSLRNQFIQEIKKAPGILESEPVISEHLRLRHIHRKDHDASGGAGAIQTEP